MKHRWVSIALWSFAVYVTPFLLVLLDEEVLDTRMFSDQGPDWLYEAFEIAYWPLIAVVRKYILESAT